LRDGQAGVAKSFTLRKFVAAALDGARAVSVEAESVRGVCRCKSGTISERENCVGRIRFRATNDFRGGFLRIFETEGQRAIAPRIFKLVAAVGAKLHFDAKGRGSVGESARLVAQLASENQKFFALRIH
jgi:hypothetical protein